MRGAAYQRTVLAYHGCDEEDGLHFLDGMGFEPSTKPYDWLGPGVYFWEFGPQRALEWARDKMNRKTKPIKKPFVLGAVIHLGKCFDLLDIANTEWLTLAFPAFESAFAKIGKPIPQNKAASAEDADDRNLRFLDCAMIDWSLKQLEAMEKGPAFDTVRGAFTEGGDCYTGAKIQKKAHIQIAVRNPQCILGVFRPTFHQSQAPSLQ